MTIHNRWFQLSVAVVAMIMIANLQYSWTLFVKPLQQGTGWSLSDIQWAFTLFILCQTWTQSTQGWLIDRMGPRVFISVAGVLCGVGWGGLGYARSLPMLYSLYALAGLGAALVYGGSIGLALKWFTERRGLAAGIIAAAFGGGTALFVPLIAAMLRSEGYQRTLLTTGVFQGAMLLCAAQLLRYPPPAAAHAQPPSAAPARSKVGRQQCTTREMLCTPQFYALYIAFIAMATGGLLVTANAGPIAQAWGIPTVALAAATSLNALANGASRVFWGWVSDRIGRELAMGTAFVLQAGCLLLVLAVGRLSGTLFTVTLVLVFFTWGEVFSLFPSILGDYYGILHVTSNYGVLYSAKGVASIIGGGVAAVLYERFGTWTACLAGSAVLALLSATIVFGLYVARVTIPARAILAPTTE
jgi:MFS transporter, OFA family, oxalate/formate antiporter